MLFLSQATELKRYLLQYPSHVLALVRILSNYNKSYLSDEFMISRFTTKLTEGFRTDNDPFLYRRLMMTAALLGITLFSLIAFAFINYFNQNYQVFVIDIAFIILASISLYLLFIKKKLIPAILISSTIQFVFLIALSYISKNHEFGLVWTLCFPLFVMPMLGPKWGLIMTLAFYAILVPLVYSGLGEWDNGYWNMPAFMRFLLCSFTVVFIAYFFESSTNAAYTAVIENREKEKKYLAKLENLSVTDQLTGLYNRRFFDEQFDREQEKVNRYGLNLCVVMMDIDHFKRVNDKFGHQLGDEVLQEFSSLVKDGVRSTDIVSRWGGEEFIALLPETSLPNAAVIAEKLRVLVEEHDFSKVGKLTASFGVATIAKQLEQNGKAIRNVDTALYQAKKQGRNRVVIFEPENLQS